MPTSVSDHMVVRKAETGHGSVTTDRRNFLKWSFAGAALAVPPTGLLARQRATYPPDVGSKFYADGRVHPFAGNTIICHLPQQGEHAACFNTMLDIYREAPTHGFIRKVALLPPSSYHMTVFGGANDRPRERQTWPADLPMDLPMEACNRALADRLRTFEPDIMLPIRMRVDPMQDPLSGSALIFRLQPLDDAENMKIRNLRNRLADVLKIRARNHATYQFHVSFGYKIAWLDDVGKHDLERTWRRWASQISRECPEIILGAPEFCTFDDMFAFHRQFYLGQNG